MLCSLPGLCPITTWLAMKHAVFNMFMSCLSHMPSRWQLGASNISQHTLSTRYSPAAYYQTSPVEKDLRKYDGKGLHIYTHCSCRLPTFFKTQATLAWQARPSYMSSRRSDCNQWTRWIR